MVYSDICLHWEAVLNPSNASVNATFALGRALNGVAVGSAALFTGQNGTLNGSAPFNEPNFCTDGEDER